jgi:hypothetical protein
MSGPLQDRIAETSTSTGTGDFTLAGALTGYDAFSDVFTIGDQLYYLIEAVDGSGLPTGDWELGRGSYSALNTLSRLDSFRSVGGGAGAITFAAGTKRVHVVAPARVLSWRGSIVTKSANQTAANYTSATAITWDSRLRDTGVSDGTGTAFWSSGANTRLTIPAAWGTIYVEIVAQVSLQNITSSDLVTLQIKQNNAALTTSGNVGGIIRSAQATTTPVIEVRTPPLITTGADYFTTHLTVGTDTSIDMVATESFFSLKVLGEYYS